MAAEVRLAVRSAEHLVVRRHDVDLPRRAHAQLDARASEVLSVDALLDDAALLVERRQVLLDVDLLILELDRRTHIARCRSEIDQRVPETADTEVELENRRASGGTPSAELAEGVHKIVRTPDVEADRVAHVLVHEDLPTPRLGAEPAECRVAAVDGQLERLRETDLVRGHAERNDHRHLGLADQAPDPFERSRTCEQLAGERFVPPVDERDRLEAASRLRGVELGNEREVVVEHARVDRLGRHVDDA